MTLRPSTLFALLGVILLALVVIAIFLPRGSEKLVAHQSSKTPGATLRACLGTGLGLGEWQGPPVAMRASRFGLRVVVTDNGPKRQVGVFTAGGQPLSSGQSAAVQACLGGN
jgi:hypothetical protein